MFNGLRIGDAFLLKYARGECFRSVTGHYRAGALKNNRAVIVLVVRVMHGAA